MYENEYISMYIDMYENEYISMYIPMYVGIGMNTPHVVDFATISLTILGVHVPHGEGGRHGALL